VVGCNRIRVQGSPEASLAGPPRAKNYPVYSNNYGYFCRRAPPPLQNPPRPFKRGPPERWPSGLRRTLGKRVCGKPYRGFESHSLRQFIRGDYSPGKLVGYQSPIAAAFSYLASEPPNLLNCPSVLRKGRFLRTSVLHRFDTVLKMTSHRALKARADREVCPFLSDGRQHRFPIRHLGVRILLPQPTIPAFGQASREAREKAGNGRKSPAVSTNIPVCQFEWLPPGGGNRSRTLIRF
jgi:hypothetical protein